MIRQAFFLHSFIFRIDVVSFNRILKIKRSKREKTCRLQYCILLWNQFLDKVKLIWNAVWNNLTLFVIYRNLTLFVPNMRDKNVELNIRKYSSRKPSFCMKTIYWFYRRCSKYPPDSFKHNATLRRNFAALYLSRQVLYCNSLIQFFSIKSLRLRDNVWYLIWVCNSTQRSSWV